MLVGGPVLGLSAALVLLGSGPVERQAEHVDDAEAEGHAEQPCPPGVGEGDGGRVRLEPAAAQGHVRLNGLHLEVRAYDAADVKQLVAVTCREKNPQR